ncbi:hypothetical protein F3Y22_tig00006992pilonHSYRG00049 [Hibiscus syriacus]|uniref:RNase H type-1 domain-containing protein n=1 Tax=Hibiscus syriacus TaxID=106335 RepID=A0A6A3CFF6_HIBSY|nr:hypothetical protein F3Y22_tig00006992pilonHSYRG00049 [Hibiscus syriacus]
MEQVFFNANLADLEEAQHNDNSTYSSINDRVWHALTPGWIALNSDGVVSTSSSLGSAGGVLIDSLGSWLGGFWKPLGYVTIIQAVLWGLYDGLKLAWSQGFEKVQCQIDNVEVYNMVSSSSSRSSPLPLVREIVSLHDRAWLVDYKLVHCEANSAAYALAKLSLDQVDARSILGPPPDFLQNSLLCDNNRSPRCRTKKKDHMKALLRNDNADECFNGPCICMVP